MSGGAVTVSSMPITTDGDPKEPDRHVVALHEAGHAVLAHLLGIPVESMALHPDGWLAGGLKYTPYAPDSDDSLLPQQCANVACMALGGEAAEVLEYGSADPEGLLQDYATFWNMLGKHPAVGLPDKLKARARELLSAPGAMSAVRALAADLEQAGALDAAAVQIHVRRLPRCKWALARAG